jgi:6-pyruvoyl-tetrahydropterin synthase
MRLHDVQRTIDIHYAHRIPRHTGKCAGLHGHRGTLEVTLTGPLELSGPATGMVTDFAAIDSILNIHVKSPFCHATILWREDPLIEAVLQWGARLHRAEVISADDEDGQIEEIVGSFGRFMCLPKPPTAEYLAYLFFTLLDPVFRIREVRLTRVKFWETAHSVAIYPGAA